QVVDTIGEAFRMLRFNLDFMARDARVIMLTSTVPGEGKSFVSRNLAYTLSLIGKRVVLVDTDIRRRTQSRLLAKGSGRKGLTSFLAGVEDDVTKLIVKEDDEHHLDFLPAGMTPPNPAELLMSDRLERCVEQLKQHYDYIVIDNVPAQVVADAGIVNRVADITLYVIRVGRIDRRYLPQLEEMHKEGKFKNLSVVLNGLNLHKRYGYSYGYGYNYNYGGYSSSGK
ncbi:MAG: CpsD/CapB family tyrosine-protein kinase, partial [Bacteroidaceae bacterium]|nr:CpsD/CapB family tyrosine-protein kinase [Bacteroidaceae bacterium]